MGKARAVIHRELAKELRQWRADRGWSVQQVVIAARAKGFALTHQAVRGVETGQTRHPDRDLLQGLAAAYSLDYLELAGRFIERNYGVGLGVLSMLPLQPQLDIAPKILAALTDAENASQVQMFLEIDPQFRAWICAGPFPAARAAGQGRGSSPAQSAAKRTKQARSPRR